MNHLTWNSGHSHKVSPLKWINSVTGDLQPFPHLICNPHHFPKSSGGCVKWCGEGWGLFPHLICNPSPARPPTWPNLRCPSNLMFFSSLFSIEASKEYISPVNPNLKATLRGWRFFSTYLICDICDKYQVWWKPARLKIHLWFVPIFLSPSSLVLHTSSHFTPAQFKSVKKRCGLVARQDTTRGGSELGEASTSGRGRPNTGSLRVPRPSCTMHMDRF